MPKRFTLKVSENEKIYIADGIELETLQCIISWRTKYTRPTLFSNIRAMLTTHKCTEDNITWSNA